MNGFEGSFLGNNSRIDPASVLECGVCWWVYDPALGDETWQIPAGTAFADLPGHWRCPSCDNAPEQFMVLRGEAPLESVQSRPPHEVGLEAIRQYGEKLQRAYTAVSQRMRALPVYNQQLDIQVLGLRRCSEGVLGVVATPWCMNIVLLPPAGAPQRMEGTTREIALPSGSYTFIAGQLPGVGALETCSLFSPMDEFDDPAIVRSVAEHVITGLFSAVASAPQAQDTPQMSRRRFLRGGGAQAHDQPIG